MSAESTLPVEPGALVAGKYRTERLLGKGGMGAVVAARPLGGGELVAIKLMLPKLVSDEHFVARFQREARATLQLGSEHVPRVLEVGVLPSGAPYLVMEYFEGADLRSVVKERGTLPVDKASDYVGQACVALAEAHGLGIIHRDLKPANLFLASRGEGRPLIKVLDFGIAKFTSAAAAGDGLEMTQTETVLGSRLYMAPEQMRSPRDVDARADVWGLGICLYHLVTGTTPFAGATTEEVIVNVLMHAPHPLRAHAPHVPEAYEAVVLRCLEKDVKNRYQSAIELAAALSPFTYARGESSAAYRISAAPEDDGATTVRKPPILADSGTPLPSAAPPLTHSSPAWQQATSPGAPPRSRAATALLGGTVLLAAAATTALLLARAEPAPAPAAAEAPQTIEAAPPSAPPAPVPALAESSPVASAAQAGSAVPSAEAPQAPGSATIQAPVAAVTTAPMPPPTAKAAPAPPPKRAVPPPDSPW